MPSSYPCSPPIVDFAALLTPSRSLRADFWNIVSLAIGLVLASTRAAAGVALVLVPSMTVPLATVLGAIVAPSDEAAAMAVIVQEFEAISGVCRFRRSPRPVLDDASFREAHQAEAAQCYFGLAAHIQWRIYGSRSY